MQNKVLLHSLPVWQFQEKLDTEAMKKIFICLSDPEIITIFFQSTALFRISDTAFSSSYRTYGQREIIS